MSEVYLEGRVEKMFSGGVCRVRLNESKTAKCKISGKMDHHDIDVTVGDKVEVKFHESDLSTGMIVRRLDE